MGIAVGGMKTAPKGFAELNKLTDDSTADVGNKDISQGYISVRAEIADDVLAQDNIENICSEQGNFIAVKYY